MPPLWQDVIAVGALCVLVGVAADRYHTRAFRTHQKRLRHHAAKGDEDAVSAEVRRFRNDRTVDWAMRLMLMDLAGIFLIVVGLGWALQTGALW